MSLFTSSMLGAILAGPRVARALICYEWPSGALRATQRSPRVDLPRLQGPSIFYTYSMVTCLFAVRPRPAKPASLRTWVRTLPKRVAMAWVWGMQSSISLLACPT
eukprot:7057641-Heterocapsa_arctica.AAC.1